MVYIRGTVMATYNSGQLKPCYRTIIGDLAARVNTIPEISVLGKFHTNNRACILECAQLQERTPILLVGSQTTKGPLAKNGSGKILFQRVWLIF